MTRKWTLLRRCFAEPHARLGWLLLLIGAIAWQMFGRHADWTSVLFLRRQLAQANGIVREVNGTEFTLGDDSDGMPIRCVLYEFVDTAGLQRTGRSWSESLVPRRGEQVTVEFVVSQPGINRIENFRSAPLPLWVGAVILFPIVGVSCVLRVIIFSGDPPRKCLEESQDRDAA